MLARALCAGPADFHDVASRVGRLQGVTQRIRHSGGSARRVAHSILIVHAATLLPVRVAVALLIDSI